MIFKKLRVLISAQHALMLAYRAEIYLWTIAHILPFIMMGIWTTAAQSTSGGNFSMKPVDYERYFLAVYITRQLTAIWMIYEFEWHILEGRYSYYLLRPLNPLWHYVAGHLGEQLARFPFFVLIIAIFFMINPQALWVPTVSSVVFGIIAIYCAFTLRFVLQYCFANLTFWFERAAALEQLTFVPYMFLSGMIIPLSDFPPGWAFYTRLTPFPYFVDFPASIITGRLTPADPAFYQGFGMIVAWFVVLFAIAVVLNKRGLKQYSGQGA
jgi:ABC-2 type transport system permease protein